MNAPHEYIPAQLGHSNLICKWCSGTPRENEVLDPNHCEPDLKAIEAFGAGFKAGMERAVAETTALISGKSPVGKTRE